MSADNQLRERRERLTPPLLEFDRAEGEITEADDAGAKHQQPKQAIFKNAGEAPGRGRWRTHYIAAKRSSSPLRTLLGLD